MVMEYKLYCKSHLDYYKYYFISNFNLEESLILNFILLFLDKIKKLFKTYSIVLFYLLQ